MSQHSEIANIHVSNDGKNWTEIPVKAMSGCWEQPPMDDSDNSEFSDIIEAIQKPINISASIAWDRIAEDWRRVCEGYVPLLRELISTINVEFFPWYFSSPTRAQIRQWKHERKQRRHAFLCKGKHGLRRPKGKRNA